MGKAPQRKIMGKRKKLDNVMASKFPDPDGDQNNP
jgi:hypothetical protein